MLTFAGESFATDSEGQIIARAPREKNCILYAEVDFSQLEKCPARKHFLLDRRSEIYSSL